MSKLSLQLRPHIHWCNSGGRVVFLDSLADRYFGLPNSLNEAFLRLAAGEPTSADMDCLRILVDCRVLSVIDGAAAIAPPPRIETPTHDLAEDRSAGSPPLALLEALIREVRASRSLRQRSLHLVLSSARRRRVRQTRPGIDPTQRLRRVAAAAEAIALLTRRHDRCLVRALAVHATCRRSGAQAKLVFGVIAHPFTAHCWVQAGRGVVVGGYEHARLYTPILVI
jgi:hypothetical protein